MSELVYTELEATPIRWRYGGAVPVEPASIADNTGKTFNTTVEDFTVINMTNYLSIYNITSTSIMVAQRFSPSQPVRLDGIKLYLAKSGSPTGTFYCKIVGWDAQASKPDLNTVLATGSMSISSITSGFSNLFTFTSPIFLTPADDVAVLAHPDPSSTLNSSNYVQIRYSSTNIYTPSDMLTSTNSGDTWTDITDRDLYVRAVGSQAITIYTGNISITSSHGAATGSARLSTRVKAVSGTVYITGDVGNTYMRGSQSSSTSSTAEVELTALEPTTAVPQGNQTWRIWAVGNGRASWARIQRHEYYNVNPVHPRDFGFTELYLISVKSTQPNTVLRINDRTGIHLPNNGDIFQVGEGFRTPVRKMHFPIGAGDVDLLGVE